MSKRKLSAAQLEVLRKMARGAWVIQGKVDGWREWDSKAWSTPQIPVSTPTLRCLERDGLIARTDGPSVWRYHITEAGKRAIEEARWKPSRP